MELDSHSGKPSSSSSVGTRECGFSARYAGSLFLPNAPPTSMRVCSSLSSPTAHIAFCTLDEVLRPQILIIVVSFPYSLSCPTDLGFTRDRHFRIGKSA